MKNKLPEGWGETTLGEISLDKGQYGSGASVIEYDSKKPVYVRITDIDDDGNLKESDQRSPSETEEKYFLEYGDFLFARSGSVGRTYLHQKKEGKYQYAGYLIRFKLNHKLILPKYLYYVTKSNYYWGWINKTQKSVTISNINAQQYASFSFILPPLSTQKKIVSILEIVNTKKHIQNSSTQSMNGMVSKSVFEKIEYVCPPIELQTKFSKIVEKVEKLKECQKQSKKQIDDLFNALMQRVFKGELI